MRRIAGGDGIAEFCLDTVEVSSVNYRACFTAGVCSAPTAGDGHGCNHFDPPSEEPIGCVSFDQAQTYCHWLSRRLPSEREWAWAAQGGPRRTTFPWGDADDGRACLDRSEDAGPCLVGRTADASPEGVHDLAGNVAEWTVREDGGGSLRGGVWRYRWEPDADARRLPQVSLTSGFRCAVELAYAHTLAVPRPTSLAAPAREPLVDLAWAPAPVPAPAWPLDQLDVLGQQPVAEPRWSELADGRFLPFVPAAPSAHGLRGAVDRSAFPASAGRCTPLRGLRSLVVFACDDAERRRLIAVDREGKNIRWQNPYRGRKPEQDVHFGLQTLVIETRDAGGAGELFGYSLATGEPLWRSPLARDDRTWFHAGGVYRIDSRLSRPFLRACDPASGDILWSRDAGCGLVHGEALVIEDARGFHRLDPATGAELATLGPPRSHCGSATDLSSAPQIAGGRLHDFTPSPEFAGGLRVFDLATGQERWRRAHVAPEDVAIDADAVYLLEDDHFLALDPATGAVRVTLTLQRSTRGPRVYAVDDPTGPWVLVDGLHHAIALGRALGPVVPEEFVVQGRIVGAGLPPAGDLWHLVTLGPQHLRFDDQGRFEAQGTRSVGTRLALESTELNLAAASITLDGRRRYDLGTVRVRSRR
nr:SUMF1/EgtB/PvdO family nonheme iron enzyme [Nannocystis sp. RBIL2]